MQRIVSIILIFMLLLATVAGCGSQTAKESTQDTQQAESQEQGPKKPSIAVIPKALDSEFWLDVKSGAEKEIGRAHV